MLSSEGREGVSLGCPKTLVRCFKQVPSRESLIIQWKKVKEESVAEI